VGREFDDIRCIKRSPYQAFASVGHPVQILALPQLP
jgi:hypothetical protein